MKTFAMEVVKRITYADLIVGSWLLVGLIAYAFIPS